MPKLTQTRSVPRPVRARFFHPRTLGVMLPGQLVKEHPDGSVSVRFDIDKKVWRTCAERICEGRC